MGKPPAHSTGTGDVFTDGRLDLSYTRRGQRATSTAKASGRRDSFRACCVRSRERERERESKSKDWLRPTKRLAGAISTIYHEAEFFGLSLQRVDKDKEYKVRFSYEMGRNPSLRLERNSFKHGRSDRRRDYKETRHSYNSRIIGGKS